MPSYKMFATKKICLLTGSKAEWYHYSEQILDGGRECKRIFDTSDLPLLRPTVWVAGTGHLTRFYEDIARATIKRKGIIHAYDTPGLVIMPALEIAHEFAEYLGIDPEWRYDSEE